jgi:signal peptidase II
VSTPAAGVAERRRSLLGRVLAVAAAVVVVDQVTKSLALSALDDGPIHLLWTLRLNLTFNSGLAFSQGRGMTGLITVAAVALVAGLLWWARQVTTPGLAVAIGLILGGACGNLADRLLRGHGGAVVDFIDLQWWPIFNVADAALTCGAVLVIVLSWSRR